MVRKARLRVLTLEGEEGARTYQVVTENNKPSRRSQPAIVNIVDLISNPA